MSNWFRLLLLLLSTSSMAQFKLFPIQGEAGNRNARLEIVADTLELPFWDDFSTSAVVADSSRWFEAQHVFVNNSLPINPPSLNVATFDGINDLGSPHNPSSTFGGAGDSLISHAINLSGIPKSLWETVYFSFYWQLKGNGEIPEPQDSLALYFFDDKGQWISQDLTPNDRGRNALFGGLDNLGINEDSAQYFQMVMVPVIDDGFFHEGFKFKFQSYSSLSGVYDTWHVDYVYLNKDREEDRTTFFDRTLARQPNLLFAPYHEITISQYRANPGRFSIPQSTEVNNLDRTFHPLEFYHRIVNLQTNQELNTGDVVNFRLDPLEFGRQINGLSIEPSIVSGDSVILMSEFVYNTGDRNLFEVISPEGDTLFLPVDLKTNDTVRQYYTLHQHMAYDDGVADFAAGINTITGKLAVQYVLNEPDTLTGLRINFPAMSPSTQGVALDIIVWSQLDDTGTLLRQTHQVANTDRTSFNEIQFTTPIYLQDTFYVGFEQFTENYVGVGFDKDNPLGSTFIYSNTERQWVQNLRSQGSLMIRPVFAASDFVLATEKPQADDLVVYPNPTDGQINIQGQFAYLEIWNLIGQRLLGSHDSQIDLSHLPSGVYIIRIQSDSGWINRRIRLE